MKDSSFSLLTNCFNPRAILRGEDSEVCITNIQAYNLSEDLQETRILEMEYLPLIYNELNQHISINLLLNRMNSYAPVLAGEVNKELYNPKLPQPVVQVSPGITSDYGILTVSNASAYRKFGAAVVSVKTEDDVLCTESPDSISVRIDDNDLIYAQAMVEDFEPSPEYEKGLNPHLKTQEPVEACYTVEGKMMVSLECDTPGSIIYYTVSSNKTLPAEPTLSSTLYTEPFEYNGETIKAKAFKPGYLEPSNTVVIGEKLLGFKSNDTKLAGYNGNVVGYNSISVEQPQRLPTPVLNCTYPTLSTGHITVANASDFTDAPVYVTLYADGEKIATALASELSVDITENRSYTARAFSTGRWGSYRSEALVPNLKVPTPTIMIHTEDDIEAWTVSMACSLADSEIHYTMTENATPNSDSPVYSSPLPYRGETVKAIATKDQVQDSDIATAGSAILSTKDGILGYDGDPVGYDVLN
ncbi:MAG: chitobiase/beta-hexosaminidase C-terminal domain-containing protein [Phocaeicola sp.]